MTCKACGSPLHNGDEICPFPNADTPEQLSSETPSIEDQLAGVERRQFTLAELSVADGISLL